MSTFKLPQSIKITFDEDSIYHGAEVRCRANVSVREALELTQAQPDDPESVTAEESAALIDAFARIVVTDWNLVDENDEPIPVTPETVAKQPAPFVLQLFEIWSNAVLTVPKVSPAPSLNGSTSKVASGATGAE